MKMFAVAALSNDTLHEDQPVVVKTKWVTAITDVYMKLLHQNSTLQQCTYHCFILQSISYGTISRLWHLTNTFISSLGWLLLLQALNIQLATSTLLTKVKSRNA